MPEPESATVGIVMRTKDRPILLRRALQSVCHQSHTGWRLAVVNDGGAPGPVEECAKSVFGDSDTTIPADITTHDASSEESASPARIQIIHNAKSVGMQNASNQGIARLPSVDYLVIHDDDDAWDPAFLKTCVDWLEQAPENTPGVITRSRLITETVDQESGTVHTVKEEPYNPDLTEVSFFRMLARNFFPPIAFVFRRAALDAVGLFREECSILGDWDFNVRFLRKYEIGVIPEELAHYHIRSPITKPEDADAAQPTPDEPQDARNEAERALSPAADNVYGNTITSGLYQHRHYDTLLRNQWLRDDLEAGRPGIGMLASLGDVLLSQLKDHLAAMDGVLSRTAWLAGNIDRNCADARHGTVNLAEQVDAINQRTANLEQQSANLEQQSANLEERAVNLGQQVAESRELLHAVNQKTAASLDLHDRNHNYNETWHQHSHATLATVQQLTGQMAHKLNLIDEHVNQLIGKVGDIDFKAGQTEKKAAFIEEKVAYSETRLQRIENEMFKPRKWWQFFR